MPNGVKQLPKPNISLISENIMGVSGTTKIDTIRSPSARRGIRRKDYHNVFYLMDLQGNIIKKIDLGIGGGGHLKPVDDDIMMVLGKNRPSRRTKSDTRLYFLDSKGNELWQIIRPFKATLATKWYSDENYIYAYNPTYSTFVILKKENGQLIDSFATTGENLIGSLFDVYRIDDEIFLSYSFYDRANRKAKFRTSKILLDKMGKIRSLSHEGEDQLLLKLGKSGAFLHYADSPASPEAFTLRVIREGV